MSTGKVGDVRFADFPTAPSIFGDRAPLDPRCVPGHYYLLNNYAPGYFGDGSVNTGAVNPFTVPPSTVPTIGDSLRSKDVSFAYFGDQYNRYLADPNFANPADIY